MSTVSPVSEGRGSARRYPNRVRPDSLWQQHLAARRFRQTPGAALLQCVIEHLMRDRAPLE